MGTPLRVHQSPTAGNPPTALDSPQRATSTLRLNFNPQFATNLCKVVLSLVKTLNRASFLYQI
ncbi:hypothetical protein [Nostoc sp.]|uniref:hypothetical protein n=1 Tax=Nostoc sp. TaxID=1180 RepID=UPI002FF8D041